MRFLKSGCQLDCTGTHPTDLILYPSHFLTGLISKYNHILRFWDGGGLSQGNLGNTEFSSHQWGPERKAGLVLHREEGTNPADTTRVLAMSLTQPKVMSELSKEKLRKCQVFQLVPGPIEMTFHQHHYKDRSCYGHAVGCAGIAPCYPLCPWLPVCGTLVEHIYSRASGSFANSVASVCFH